MTQYLFKGFGGFFPAVNEPHFSCQKKGRYGNLSAFLGAQQ